jgi:hypothetical protein
MYDQNTPAYLKSIVNIHKAKRLMRSSLAPTFDPPNYKLKTVGGRGFNIHLGACWNALPTDLRNITNFAEFKNQLKTHLFRQAFVK